MLKNDFHWAPLTKKLLPLILEWRNADDVRKNMYTSHVISLEEHENWFSKMNKDSTKEYFVFYRQNIPQGVVGFSEIKVIDKTAVWAFYANPTAPRGTGSLMEYKALQYFFKEKGFYKLNCEVLSFNVPVIRLHQKFGFIEEGVIRHGHFNEAGYHDIVKLGIFDHEWAKKAEEMANKLGVESEE